MAIIDILSNPYWVAGIIVIIGVIGTLIFILERKIQRSKIKQREKKELEAFSGEYTDILKDMNSLDNVEHNKNQLIAAGAKIAEFLDMYGQVFTTDLAAFKAFGNSMIKKINAEAEFDDLVHFLEKKAKLDEDPQLNALRKFCTDLKTAQNKKSVVKKALAALFYKQKKLESAEDLNKIIGFLHQNSKAELILLENLRQDNKAELAELGKIKAYMIYEREKADIVASIDSGFLEFTKAQKFGILLQKTLVAESKILDRLTTDVRLKKSSLQVHSAGAHHEIISVMKHIDELKSNHEKEKDIIGMIKKSYAAITEIKNLIAPYTIPYIEAIHKSQQTAQTAL